MKQFLLLTVFTLLFSGVAQAQEREINRTPPVSSSGLYNGNLAQIGLFRNTSLSFGPSMNQTSMFNFYEFPVLFHYSKENWEIYAGAQMNWMLDQEQLNLGNRFGSEIWGTSSVMGIRYNVDEHFFMELKYTRNFAPEKMQNLFNSVPSSKTLFEFGAGYKF